MNWITNFVRPRIKGFMGAKPNDTPENLWKKCTACGEMIFHRDLEAAQFVCPKWGHHMRIGTASCAPPPCRRMMIGSSRSPAVPADPLRFRDERKYADRLKDARAKTGKQD